MTQANIFKNHNPIVKVSKYILTVFLLVFIGCSTKKPIQQTKQPYQPKPITKSYNLTTTDGINLKVEIDYKLSELGYLNNNCECNYIITCRVSQRC
jgi:hypothetical protein